MAGRRYPPSTADFNAYKSAHPEQGYKAIASHFMPPGADDAMRKGVISRCKRLDRRYTPAPTPATYTEPSGDFLAMTPLRRREAMVEQLWQMMTMCQNPGQMAMVNAQLLKATAELEALQPAPEVDEEEGLTDDERRHLIGRLAEESALDDLEVIVQAYLRRTRTMLTPAINVLEFRKAAEGGDSE